VKPDFQEQFQAIMSDAALDAKTKELVALAVSAQVPCRGLLADNHVPKARQVLRKLLGAGRDVVV
jgi:alkylhydroperoxidase/carboxymuconolactone decarboxylase family protein YurZ